MVYDFLFLIMNILYQKNQIILRKSARQDCARLAAVLRPEDRAELAASHPGREAGELMGEFFDRSARCFTLEFKGEVAAVFGLSPGIWLGRRACVWLLSGKSVEKIPKTFVRVARILLGRMLAEYPELYNFADGRYAAALRFIRRLGGSFDGTFYDTPSARFLGFTFRRK